MSGDSTSSAGDTSQDASVNTKDNAAKDENVKDAEGQGGKGKDDADKGKGTDDTAALKKALKAERDRANALEKAQRDSELSKLPELERAKAIADELTKENEQLKTENQRMKVGMKLGLPWNLAKRLSGDTEEEMRADAADLLNDYKPVEKQVLKDDPKNKRPPNDAKKSGAAGGPGMNDILRALAGRKAS